MADPKLLRTEDLDPSEVDCSGRLRPVREAGVEALMASISETGIVMDAIHVREIRRRGTPPALVLMAGGHRAEACRRMELRVPAKIWRCDDDWARLIELDDNLAGGDLDALDLAVFMAERRRLYQKLHPETARGVAGAAARWDATEPGAVAFSKAVAQARGISERQVFKIAAAGAALDGRDVQLLRNAPQPVTLKDLTEISKIGNVSERYYVCEALGRGEAKKVAEARRQFAAQAGKPATAKDPAETALHQLKERFRRLPKPAKRRFVEAFREELEMLLAEGGDG